MADQVTLFRVFVASPGGLDGERGLFRQTLHEYNESEAIERGTIFVPVGWELTLPGAGRPQELINRDLRACDYLMLLLWDRWGSPTETGSDCRFTSGVEEEFNLACECLADKARPMQDVVVLFKAVEPGKLADPGPQLSKVLEFKKSLEASKTLLFATYDNSTSLQQHMRRCLAHWLRQGSKEWDRHATKTSWYHIEGSAHGASVLELPQSSSRNPLLKKAQELANAGRLVEAETEFSRALVSSGSAESLIKYGIFLIRLGRLAQARVLLDRARLEKIPQDCSLASECLRALGTIEMMHGNLDAATGLFREALQHDERSEDFSGCALDQENLGRIRSIQGAVEEARQLHLGALKVSERAADLGSVGRQKKYLADILRRDGHLADAEPLYLEALKIFERLGLMAEIAGVRGALGLLALARQDPDSAAKAFRAALEIEQRLGQAEGIATQYSHLGMAARAKRNLAEASSYFERSLEINAANGFLLGVSVVSRHIGSIHLALGQLDHAEQFYRRALEVSESMGTVEGVANAYFDLGRVYKRRGELSVTRALWEKAADLYQKIGSTRRVAAMNGRLNSLAASASSVDRI